MADAKKDPVLPAFYVRRRVSPKFGYAAYGEVSPLNAPFDVVLHFKSPEACSVAPGHPVRYAGAYQLIGLFRL